MDLLTGAMGPLYRRYLFAAFGSAIIMSIYGTVDIIVCGQYEGPIGSAALSVIMPVWSVTISIGLLIGIGGAILMSTARGAKEEGNGNGYFTVSLLSAIAIALLLTVLFLLFREEFLQLCGADAAIMPYAVSYVQWIIPAIPLFLVGQVMVAFIRNDGAPRLAMAAIVSGGVFNIFGDIFFVFTCDMGMAGAGLATALGQLIGVLILCGYLFSKSCTLRLVKVVAPCRLLTRVFAAGFAPFIIDISFGVTILLFNNQIMRYAGATELAVFGAVANVAILFQSLFYGAGQALQPIVSANAGAGQMDRVRAAQRWALITAGLLGVLFCAIVEAIPSPILCAYMDASEAVLAIGPAILRVYGLSFLFMGINVVAGYYLQAVLQTAKSLTISLLRGFILCALLVFLLPAVFGFSAIWWTMPLTELLTAAVATAILLREKSRPLPPHTVAS